MAITDSQKIDLLITEPFLGKPKPNPAKVPFILKGLEKLYRGAFRHWSKILKDGATVVIVIPSIVVQDKKGKTRIYTLEKLIDSLASLGYTTSSEPIEYFREQAIVRRNIYTFTYNTENKA